jgi:hypothetical protein
MKLEQREKELIEFIRMMQSHAHEAGYWDEAKELAAKIIKFTDDGEKMGVRALAFLLVLATAHESFKEFERNEKHEVVH